MRRIYVAASSKEIERAERVMAKLREAGHEVTSTWPVSVRAHSDPNPMDKPRDYLRQICLNNCGEMNRADTLLLLLPEQPTIGAWFEFGYMYADPMKWVIVAGVERSIYSTLTPMHFATDDEAIAALAKL